MTNIVLYGDGLLCPPHGYGEQFADLLALRRPSIPFQAFQTGAETLDLESALKGAALHVIGKAPDLIYLGLGHSDLMKKTPPEKMGALMSDLLRLLMAKTNARIAFTSSHPAFLTEDLTQAAQSFNTILQSLNGERAHYIDLNAAILGFLEKHKVGPGEKRSLHHNPLRLTSMGRTLLSHAALDDLFSRNLIPL